MSERLAIEKLIEAVSAMRRENDFPVGSSEHLRAVTRVDTALTQARQELQDSAPATESSAEQGTTVGRESVDALPEGEENRG